MSRGEVNVLVCCSGAVSSVGGVAGPPPAHHASGARLPGYLQPYSPTYLVPQHPQQHLWYTDWAPACAGGARSRVRPRPSPRQLSAGCPPHYILIDRYISNVRSRLPEDDGVESECGSERRVWVASGDDPRAGRGASVGWPTPRSRGEDPRVWRNSRSIITLQFLNKSMTSVLPVPLTRRDAVRYWNIDTILYKLWFFVLY